MAINAIGRTTIQGATTVGGFNPATLFSAGEQGVWYDPSDLSTLFQDSAGTIPVTALEQPVGRMLDKSGRGNTATQATSANRPVVSARVNLLTYTEQFDNAAWSTSGLNAVSANSTIAPNGTVTADTITTSATNTIHDIYNTTGISFTSGVSYTHAVYLKKNTNDFAQLSLGSAAFGSNAWANFDLVNGVLGSVGSAATASITSVGYGWYRCAITAAATATASSFYVVDIANSASMARQATWSAAGTESIYIWGADLRPTNQGVGLPVYQRVGAAVAGASTTVGNADYNANGFPVYLSFDGAATSLASSSIAFSGNKMSAFAGMRKLNTTAATQIAIELSASLASNNGSFLIPTIGSGTTDSYRFISKGTASGTATTTPTAYNAPDTRIVTGLGDISAPSASLRLNGSLIQTDTTSQGTGNYGNYPIYVGARGGSSLYWNGYLYGLIVRGASSTANQITGAENWLNQKTAAY